MTRSFLIWLDAMGGLATLERSIMVWGPEYTPHVPGNVLHEKQDRADGIAKGVKVVPR